MLIETLHLNHVHSIAICGGGGKTSLLYALAEEARRKNQAVLVTTSTHILQPDNTEFLHFYEQNSLSSIKNICLPGHISVIGTPCQNKKITGLDPVMLDSAAAAADLFLYEADGAKHLPIKCHNPTEPVIWFGTDVVLCVLGLSALGLPAHEICHRWELDPIFIHYPEKVIDTEDFIRLALECRQKAGYPHAFQVCLNQCDDMDLLQAAKEVSNGLKIHGIPCFATHFQSSMPQIMAL